MPDLSDLLKDAVGEIPAFDAGSLVAKLRHRRQLQAAGAASTAAVVALFVGVAFNHDSGGRVAIKTTSDVSDAPPTTGSSLADGSSTTLDGSTTSSAAPPPTDTTTPVVPTVPGARGARAEDFTGTITAGPTTVRVGDTATITLSVRNASDSVLVLTSFMNSSQLSETTRQPALVCAKLEHEGDLPQGGGPMNAWWPPFDNMQPGAETHVNATYSPTAEDVGTLTCMAVLTYLNGWRWAFVDARIGSIPLVTITVLPAETATTTSTTTSSSTTTI